MTPTDTTLKVLDSQSGKYTAPALANLSHDNERRQKQSRFFTELRILKTASRLTVEQNDFACQLVNGLQKGDIAALNKLWVERTLAPESLHVAVSAAQRVFDSFDLNARLELFESEVRLWLKHPDYGSVCIGSGDSQFDCVDSAQDIALKAMAERVNDFFVMY